MDDSTHLAEYYLSAASAYLSQRQLDACLDACEAAVKYGADPLATAYARWMCFALRGDFSSAWEITDKTEIARRATPVTNLPRHLQRLWNGQSINNKRVLVRCYQGLGDTIQFIRHVPLLRKFCTQLRVQCQPRLAPLLRSLLNFDELHLLDADESTISYDIEIESLELPYIFRTTLDTIPRTVPYLCISDTNVQAARSKLPSCGFRIGLVWASGDWDVTRNIAVSRLSVLGGIPDLKFVSLQRGQSRHEIEANCENLQFHYLEDDRATILETAALIQNLDLLISVDTMSAHLAGALGKPVWLLLPFCADWRWMLHRSDSPWYPTMRIFRQPLPGDWDSVIAKIARELAATNKET